MWQPAYDAGPEEGRPQLDTEKLVDTLEAMRELDYWHQLGCAAPSIRPRTRSGARRSTRTADQRSNWNKVEASELQKQKWPGVSSFCISGTVDRLGQRGSTASSSLLEARDQSGGGSTSLPTPAAAPDLFQALGFARSPRRRCQNSSWWDLRSAGRQVEARLDDRRLQIVAVHAGEQVEQTMSSAEEVIISL